MSIFTDSKLALNRSIARAETIHRERQLLALQTLYPGQGYTIKRIAGSTTILSPPMFGRKVNHTYEFALYGRVLHDDLRAIEAAYERNGARPEFDLCEFADSSGLDLLSEHYTITGSWCEYQQSLSDFRFTATTGCSIRTLDERDHDTFVQASVDGFKSNGRSVELLKALAESAAARSDTILFSASIDGELVGTAAMAMIEAADSKIAILFCDSCLPEARGKGVHKALLLERLRIAKDRGFDLASATAREGSISAMNMEKVGLVKAYTCNIYTKDD